MYQVRQLLPTPCWFCRSFDGLDNQQTAARCLNPGCCRIRAQPEQGCSAFQREPGADDELFNDGCPA